MISIRGAITVEENSKAQILSNTHELLTEIIEANGLTNEEIISIIFSATRDLSATYPAPAARSLGITDASLLCFQEMYVENSLEMCIRVMLHVEKDCCQKDAKHVYLKGAKILRPDISLS